MKILKRIGLKSRQFNDTMVAFQRLHAKWEIENSNIILKKRRKVLAIALLPAILLVGVEVACAGGNIIGGKEAYTPSFASSTMFIISIVIGLCAGLITGCIGAGGGFILTPALMSVGVKGIMSVGTDMFHIFAKAIMGSVLHRKMGNIHVGLAVWFVAGSLIGATVGGKLNRAIYESSPALSDAFISAVYVVMLGFLGAYALYDFLRLRKAGNLTQGSGSGDITSVAKAVQSVKVPPMLHFDTDIVPGGRKISIYPVIICGFIVGFVAAIMGVGGGFLTFPMFVYGMGISTFTTVGTDIFQIIFTAGYASILQYAIHGFVFYSLAMGLLLGSLIGIQVGALATRMVKGSVIRGFYAVTVLAGFVNRLFAMPAKLSGAGYISVAKSTGELLDKIGLVIFFGLVGIFAVWVIASFIMGIGKARAEHAPATAVGAGMEGAAESGH